MKYDIVCKVFNKLAENLAEMIGKTEKNLQLEIFKVPLRQFINESLCLSAAETSIFSPFVCDDTLITQSVNWEILQSKSAASLRFSGVGKA